MIEDNLEKTEERLRITMMKLEEAQQAADESERIRKTLETKTNMEDDRISFLEAQLTQARQIAEESDKKYEEVRKVTIHTHIHIHRSKNKTHAQKK